MIKSHIIGFKKKIFEAEQKSKDSFFTWFDGGKNADYAFVKGAWDFSTHIAKYLVKYVDNPENKSILEIGYGGGRLLSAASKYFKKAIGIDIHNCRKTVEKELKLRGVNNFQLVKTNGIVIPVENSSVDVVYSFIVLQHVEKIEIFNQYIAQAYRVLKPGGIAILYFGRYCKFSVGRKSKFGYLIDKILEKIILLKGFKEIPAQINCINLLISLNYAKKISKKVGFIVCQELVSKRINSDGTTYGLQHGLVLKK